MKTIRRTGRNGSKQKRRFSHGILGILMILGSVTSLIGTPFESTAFASTIGGSWEQVETGGDFVCALAKGEVYCRGINYAGQLGNGTVDSNDYNAHPNFTKVQGMLVGKTVSSIAVGGEHACAIAGGEAYCWGYNYSGQLGDGTTTDSSVPVKVTQDQGMLAGKTVQHISTNWDDTCAIASGEAYCWGYNYSGQLGDGTTTNSSVPVKVTQTTGPLAGKTIQSITPGGHHTCAIASGEAYCWGYNYYGQLGDGTTTNSLVPVKVTQDAGLLAGKTAQSISAGWTYTCAIASGEAYCWGENANGQLGDGTTTDSSVPVKVTQDAGLLAGKTAQSISAGDSHVCAIAGGDAFCWGENIYGNLGNGTTINSSVPVKVIRNTGLPAGTVISQISASFYDYGMLSCALSEGQIYCWGYNQAGALGYDGGLVGSSTFPSAIGQLARDVFAGKTIQSMISGGNHTCAIVDGEAYCWGDNTYGQLGDGTTTDSSVPVKVTQTAGLLASKTIQSIATAGDHTCVVANDEAYCWGYNGYGQLGDGTTTDSSVPVKVTQTAGLLAGKVIQSVTTGGHHTCAIASGEAYCWGSNFFGQLGDGTTTDSSVPVKVTQTAGLLAGTTVQSIATLSDHTCAIASGEAYCWGRNYYGSLGDGTTTDSSVPVKVTQTAGLLAGKTIQGITAGIYHTCAIASGEAYCWGYNGDSELGDGTTTNSSVPVKVFQDAGLLAGKTVQSISAGDFHSCVIASGEAFCWGANWEAQLGDGTRTGSSVPLKVTQTTGLLAGKTIQNIATGSYHSCVTANNETYCWGDNRYGQLALPSESHSVNPIIVNYVFPSVGTTTDPSLSDGAVISTHPTFTGIAQPGATIVVTAHSDPVTCTAIADSNGNWSCTLPSDLPPGTHTVTVVVTDTNNNVTTLGPYTVTVATLSGNLNAPNTGGGMVLDMPFVRLIIAMVCFGILGALGFRLGRR